MMKDWASCRNLLCVRADNLGDVLMSSPAIRALKESFGCRISLLTSSMGAKVANLLDEVDEVICFDLPWIKSGIEANGQEITELVDLLKKKNFDGVIIFTVFSQNPLPAAMLMFLAGIPLRMAYCRENPYQLLTHWIPDKEPYSFMQHQVERDLLLAKEAGATVCSQQIQLPVYPLITEQVKGKLEKAGINPGEPWMIIHPGVSEKKRQYPLDRWESICRMILSMQNVQFVITGTSGEKKLTMDLASRIGDKASSFAGEFSLEELIALVKLAPVLLSVNTGTVHIASAVGTPVIVLYAMTNPQHTPWMVHSRVFYFPVDEALQSKNEVLNYIRQSKVFDSDRWPSEDEIAEAVVPFLMQTHHPQTV